AAVNETVLRFRVDNPGLDVVNRGVETIAAVNHLPVLIDDAVAGESHARAAPAAVVLQSSADVIRRLVVERTFIELSDGDDVEEIPIFPRVVPPVNAAALAGDRVVG